MGRELTTTVKCGDDQGKVKVLLESSEILTRGEIRRKFPFGAMKSLGVKGGWLHFQCDGEPVAILLNDAAGAWLARISNPPSRVSKLRIKPGMRVHLTGDVEDGVAEELSAAGATILPKQAAGTDVVLLFLRDALGLQTLPKLTPKLSDPGAIWVLWPKGAGAPVKHEQVVTVARKAGLVQTISVGFSARFTGLRLVRPAKQATS